MHVTCISRGARKRSCRLSLCWIVMRDFLQTSKNKIMRSLTKEWNSFAVRLRVIRYQSNIFNACHVHYYFLRQNNRKKKLVDLVAHSQPGWLKYQPKFLPHMLPPMSQKTSDIFFLFVLHFCVLLQREYEQVRRSTATCVRLVTPMLDCSLSKKKTTDISPRGNQLSIILKILK